MYVRGYTISLTNLSTVDVVELEPLPRNDIEHGILLEESWVDKFV